MTWLWSMDIIYMVDRKIKTYIKKNEERGKQEQIYDITVVNGHNRS